MHWMIETVLLPLLCFGGVGLSAVWWTNGQTFRGSTKQNVNKITARGRIRWTQIMASAWIHGTGAWVLFAPPETGWVAGIWGAIFYAIGCGLPGMVFAALGPSFVGITKGFSLADWVRGRFGSGVYFMLLALSLFFLFILTCAELTGLIDAYDFLLVSTNDASENAIDWIPALVVVVANAYACIGGLEVSLITDRVEGLFCACFLGMCIWVTSNLAGQVTEPIDWTLTTEAKNAAVTLILGCWINEMINQTQWQRVFSAKSPTHLRVGAVLGSCLIMAQIATFALCGVFVRSLYLQGGMPENFDPLLSGVDSFFWGLWMTNNSTVLINITLAITCCIVCSTMDTLVNAYSSLLIKPLERKNISIKWTPVLTLAFTLPAIIVSCQRLSVISLFMTINVVAVSCVPGIFLGILKGWSSAKSVLITTGMALVSVLIYGGVLEGSVIGAFEQFLFPRGPYDTHSAIIFAMCTTISAVGTPVCAYIHAKLNPESIDAEWESYQTAIRESIIERFATGDLLRCDGRSSRIPSSFGHADREPDDRYSYSYYSRV